MLSVIDTYSLQSPFWLKVVRAPETQSSPGDSWRGIELQGEAWKAGTTVFQTPRHNRAGPTHWHHCISHAIAGNRLGHGPAKSRKKVTYSGLEARAAAGVHTPSG